MKVERKLIDRLIDIVDRRAEKGYNVIAEADRNMTNGKRLPVSVARRA